MTPLNNTDKFFSDCLPPALVKDWRQGFRSHQIISFLLLQAIVWLYFFCAVSDLESVAFLDENRHRLTSIDDTLQALGVFILCGIIPFRALFTVRADTRERSSNFLMLTPLSARRIVWGTWSSTALIILLAALCALPLLAIRRFLYTAGYCSIAGGEAAPFPFDWGGFGQDALVLGWFVLCGWMMTGFCMFVAGLSRILQGIVFTAFLSSMLFMSGCTWMNRMLFEYKEAISMPCVIRNVVDVLLLMILFLELTRRHYAAPAENCSRSVRLVALLPLLGYGVALLPALFDIPSFAPEIQGTFACFFLMGALLTDALLPTYSMPPHAYRFWPVLPAWCQKPGLVSSVLCLTVALLFVCLPFTFYMNHEIGIAQGREIFYSGSIVCKIGFIIMLCLLITDCLCARRSEKRPLIFALVAFTYSFIVMCVSILPLSNGNLAGFLLTYHGIEPNGEWLSQAFYVNAAAFGITVLLLLFWRGRVKKP